ncbi:MAG: beta strand repeat-containing protein [Phycisphaerae bacterium]
MTTNMQKTLVALAVGAMFTASGSAMATTLTWDSSGTAPTKPVDGTGTWSVTAANWSNGATDAAWSNTSDSGYTAAFGNSTPGDYAGTVTLGSNITAGGLVSNAAYNSNYTIAGSGSYGLTLTGSSVVANASFTLSANTTFQQGLDLTGGQMLTLSGTNTNSVGTTVAAGLLEVMNSAVPLGAGPVTVDGGAQLNLNSYGASATSLAKVAITNNLAISGVANNPYNSALQFSGGDAVFNDTGEISISNAPEIFVTGNNQTVNLDGVMSGGGGLMVTSQYGNKHIIQFGSAETYSGNTLLISYDANNTVVKLNGGTDTLPTGTTLTMQGGGSSPLTLDLNGNNQQVAMLNMENIGGGTSAITVEDSTNAGATLTMAGTGAGTSAPGTVAAYANFADGASLNFLTNFTDSSENDGVAVFGGTTVNLASGVTFSVPLNLFLAANNTNGTINLNGGTLASNGITTGGGTGVATVNLDGTLETTAASPASGDWITPGVTLNVLSGGVTLNVASGVNATVASPFLQGANSSTGGVTVTGGGTVVMDGGNNTYTGPTTVQSGTLALGGGSSPATIADSSLLTIQPGATFDISAITAAPATLKGLTISGGTISVAMDANGNVSNIVLSSAATVSGSNTINFAAASGVTALAAGTYNLLADAGGGLAGTFLFGNGTNSEKYLLGSDSYMLTLANSNTAETLNVGAAVPVPEPAALAIFAVGSLALVLVSRKRKAQV